MKTSEIYNKIEELESCNSAETSYFEEITKGDILALLKELVLNLASLEDRDK